MIARASACLPAIRVRKPERRRRFSLGIDHLIRHWATRRRFDQLAQLRNRLVVLSLLHISQRKIMTRHPEIRIALKR